MTDETRPDGPDGDQSADETEIVHPESLRPGKTIPLASGTGEQIGNYSLLERIGEGGMGEVYAADQISPIRRKVALKIIKVGMDTKEFTARFASERQALAMMDHPYIARVFDAGATAQGRPYFVMEYVPGIPITEHCNRNRYDLLQRLELFIKVCEGIQHAHQKAIIHRDIKPSNVLVSTQEGKDWPKIIDFGVAKAIDQKLAEQTVYTQMGQIIGTPEYMSPEQADMTGENVDTRTDIYLLGVLLYEMLADVLPFDSKELRSMGFEGLLYTIRSVEPPRPSARFRALGDRTQAIAEKRNTNAGKLMSQLQGDLDWITMMAIEKDRERRYETVNALVMDIKRYLNDEPVLAGPPSTNYRIKKFVRRNRGAVMAASLVLLAIILGIAGTTIGLIQAKQAEKVANTEAETARQVSEFLVGIFDVADPSEARGNTITAREILDRGVQQIDRGLEEQPGTRARLMNTMGRVYTELGLYNEARPLLENSLATLDGIDAGQEPEAAGVMDNLGRVLRRSGDFDEARGHLETALAIREEKLGPDHPDLAQSLNSYANLLWQTGDYEQADEYYLRALAIREKVLDPDDPDLAITLNNLGGLRLQTGDFEAAQAYFERALAIRERGLGVDHPDVASSLTNMGQLFYTMGMYKEAQPYYEQALAILENDFGPDHPSVAGNLNDYACLLEDAGKLDLAEQQYRRALDIREQALGPQHPDVATSLNNYASFLRRRGYHARALPLQERALDIWEMSLGPQHSNVAKGLNNLAITLMEMGDYAAARSHLERALTIQELNYGGDHPEVAHQMANLGLVLTFLGEYEEAQRYHERSLAIWEKSHGPDHPDVATGLQNLGNLIRDNGDFATARPLLERALAIREKALGPEHIDTARSLASLGLLFYFTGELDQARDRIARALVIQTEHLAPGHPDLVENSYNLACLSALHGDRERALQCLRQAVDNGFANLYIAEDADLSSLHGDPEFERLVQEVRVRVAGE